MSCSFRSIKLVMASIIHMLVIFMLASHDAVVLIRADGSDAQLLTIPSANGKQEQLLAHAMNTSTPILRSNDGAYAWQFVPYQKNASRLLTVLNTLYNTTIIWIANRNHPVSPNASLYITFPSRSFLLRDTDGYVAWSPPISDIHTILMNSSGNLIMYNTHNDTIWQSFDNVSDVMVPGQILRTNHSAVSRRSLEDVSEGYYTLRIEPGGAILYASFDWQQQMVPYAIVTYAGQGLDVFGDAQVQTALHSACNHTELLYRMGGTGVALLQEGSVITPECRAEAGDLADGAHGIDFGTRLGGDGFRFLRLMPYGDINSFLSSNSGVALDNEFFGGMFLTYCKLPAYCGVNTLCSSRDNCTCPDMFEQIDPSNPRRGCRLIESLNCTISEQHQFLALPSTDYFANVHLPPHTVTSPEECQSLCRANCSCTAAFFQNRTGDCHLYDQVQTMLPGSDPTITAYLRVAKLPVTNFPENTTNISKKAIIGVSTGITAMVVILVLLGVWIGRRIVNKPKEESDSEEEAFLESLPGLPPRFTYKEVQSATEGFSKKLGTGGSGTVYEGHIPPADIQRNNKQQLLIRSTPALPRELLLKVAVKELQLSRLATIAASGRKQFRAEVAALGSLSHVNLVRLRGFCAEGSHRLLIYEFLENGSLDRWIFNSATPLQWDVRYQIAVDTARGLAFLHEGSRDKVLHLDVKPQNILLDANFRAKLADFGLCKLVEREAEGGAKGAAESQTVTAMRGTPGYMAPEWFLNLPVTDRSDVFSYGMVLLELVGGRKNLNLAAGSEDEWYFPAWAVRQAENGNLLDVIDKELTHQVAIMDEASAEAMCRGMIRLLHVAFWCIQENAASRPSMSTVLLMLEEHLPVLNPPLDRTYILRRQSHPLPTFIPSTTTTTSSSKSAIISTPNSGVVSELEPR